MFLYYGTEGVAVNVSTVIGDVQSYKRTAELNLFKSIGLILNLCKSPYRSYNVHQMDDNEANMCSDAT